MKMTLYDISTTFRSLTSKPENILSPSEATITRAKSLLKSVYDYTKVHENVTTKNALPELIVDNFDCEQIWQQIELQNEDCLPQLKQEVKDSVNSFPKTILTESKDSNHLSNEDIALGSEDSCDDASSSCDEQSNEDGSVELKQSDEEGNLEHSDEELGEESDESEEDVPKSSRSKKKKIAEPPLKIKHSVVDDEFFKLSEMENFLKTEEKKIESSDKMNKKQHTEEESESDDEDNESIDLFAAVSEEGEDEEEGDGIKYADFFGDGRGTEDVDDLEGSSNEDSEKEDLKEPFNQSESESDSENDLKSSLELREKRLKKRIKDIEEKAISDKPWQMKGEITAESRPYNALLEEVVDFDQAVRPAPVITEEVTYALEDIIKQRIKDKVWDSVERKERPIDTPLEYKKKLVLDHEKSKESLAKIYEREYLEQQDAMLKSIDPDKPDEELPEHLEIKKLMGSLFSKLDALSNLHYTPKIAAPELKIISNVPAASREEAGVPVQSEANMLAPEEIKRRIKGAPIGKTERTQTDKNRERRKKKAKQRYHKNALLKKEATLNKMRPGLGNKYSKEKNKKLLDKISKDRNVDKMDQSFGKIKSSTAFFARLQDEVKSSIASKAGNNKRKKSKETMNAKRFKL